MDEKQGVSVTEMDLARIREVREQLPLLRHRRTDVYALEEKAG